MKPSNFKEARINYIRCINKNTFEHIDVPILIGSNHELRLAIINHINDNPIGEKMECHYYAIYDPNFPENMKEEWVLENGEMHGFFAVKTPKDTMIMLHVNLETNKIFIRHKTEEEFKQIIKEHLGVDNVYDYMEIKNLV